MRLIAVLMITLALSGCGLARAQQEREAFEQRKAAQQEEIAQCKQLYPTSARKNNVAFARCVNVANDNFFRPSGQNLDLLDLFAAKRIEIATQMDSGKISQEQGDVLIAQARTEATTELQRRVNNNQMVAAQQQQANAAMVSAWSASAPRTCNRIGNSVTCY